MTSRIGRREWMTTSVGLWAGFGVDTALAQSGQAVSRETGTDALGRRVGTRRVARPIARRKATTTKLFLTPPGWPNAIDIDRDRKRGFWVWEQRHDNRPEAVWLLDWSGKLLHTVMTNCKDTSGACYGDGYVWSGANGASVIDPPDPPINGIFQTDMDGTQVSHRQIPFGPRDNGGATHGMAWQEDVGKMWIAANRLQAIVRIDPRNWEVDYMIPATTLQPRLHGIAYDNGHLWQVCGRQEPGTSGPQGYTPGLVKYEIASGRVVELVEFVQGSADIHDVTIHEGQLYGVDAGEHPGWSIDVPEYQHPGYPPLNSPSGCTVFRIDLLEA